MITFLHFRFQARVFNYITKSIRIQDTKPDPTKFDLECGRNGTGNADETLHRNPGARRTIQQARETRWPRPRSTQSRAESDGERFVRSKTMYQLDRGPPD